MFEFLDEYSYYLGVQKFAYRDYFTLKFISAEWDPLTITWISFVAYESKISSPWLAFVAAHTGLSPTMSETLKTSFFATWLIYI